METEIVANYLRPRQLFYFSTYYDVEFLATINNYAVNGISGDRWGSWENNNGDGSKMGNGKYCCGGNFLKII